MRRQIDGWLDEVTCFVIDLVDLRLRRSNSVGVLCSWLAEFLLAACNGI